MEPAELLAHEMSAAGLGGAKTLLVLGSGLGGFAARIEGARRVPYGELPSMPRSSVPGHAGAFVRGRAHGREVLCQEGRVHLYEGHSVEVVTRAVAAAAVLGVGEVLLTNAAGGIEATWPVPCLMRITGHQNLTRRTAEGRERSVAGLYDEGLAGALDEAALARGVSLQAGIYAGLVGPGYETAAEVRWLRRLGASAVGMSTVLEAEAAHRAGLSVAAISCITNKAAGLAEGPLHHEEVVEAGRRIAASFQDLVLAFLARLP